MQLARAQVESLSIAPLDDDFRSTPPPPAFVYVVRCADGTLYTGITNDLVRRTQRHNEGKGARYTRTRGPVKLVYYESCPNRSAALIREAAVKSLNTRRKRELAFA